MLRNRGQYLVLFVFVLLSSCQKYSGETDSSVLAKVEDVVVTERDFKEYLATLPSPLKDQAIQSLERRRALLETLLREKYLLNEAKKEGLDQDPIVREAHETQMKSLYVERFLKSMLSIS